MADVLSMEVESTNNLSSAGNSDLSIKSSLSNLPASTCNIEALQNGIIDPSSEKKKSSVDKNKLGNIVVNGKTVSSEANINDSRNTDFVNQSNDNDVLHSSQKRPFNEEVETNDSPVLPSKIAKKDCDKNIVENLPIGNGIPNVDKLENSDSGLSLSEGELPEKLSVTEKSNKNSEKNFENIFEKLNKNMSSDSGLSLNDNNTVNSENSCDSIKNPLSLAINIKESFKGIIKAAASKVGSNSVPESSSPKSSIVALAEQCEDISSTSKTEVKIGNSSSNDKLDKGNLFENLAKSEDSGEHQLNQNISAKMCVGDLVIPSIKDKQKEESVVISVKDSASELNDDDKIILEGSDDMVDGDLNDIDESILDKSDDEICRNDSDIVSNKTILISDSDSSVLIPQDETELNEKNSESEIESVSVSMQHCKKSVELLEMPFEKIGKNSRINADQKPDNNSAVNSECPKEISKSNKETCDTLNIIDLESDSQPSEKETVHNDQDVNDSENKGNKINCERTESDAISVVAKTENKIGVLKNSDNNIKSQDHHEKNAEIDIKSPVLSDAPDSANKSANDNFNKQSQAAQNGECKSLNQESKNGKSKKTDCGSEKELKNNKTYSDLKLSELKDCIDKNLVNSENEHCTTSENKTLDLKGISNVGNDSKVSLDNVKPDIDSKPFDVKPDVKDIPDAAAITKNDTKDEVKSSDIKSEVDGKTELPKVEPNLNDVKMKSEENNTTENDSRKRCADSPPADDASTKKSRLESMVGGLASRLGKRVTDLKDEDSKEETETGTEGENESSSSEAEESDGDISISLKKLNAIVKKRMEAYINANHHTVIANMQKRIDKLHAETEIWKKTAQDLSNQILELTALKRDDRKRIPTQRTTTRNMSLQVEESKIQAAMQGLASPNRPPNGVNPTSQQTMILQGNKLVTGTVVAGGHIKNMPNIAPKPVDPSATITSAASIVLPRKPHQTVREMLDEQRGGVPKTVIQTGASPTVLTSPKASTGGMVVDLTEDDDPNSPPKGGSGGKSLFIQQSTQGTTPTQPIVSAMTQGVKTYLLQSGPRGGAVLQQLVTNPQTTVRPQGVGNATVVLGSQGGPAVLNLPPPLQSGTNTTNVLRSANTNTVLPQLCTAGAQVLIRGGQTTTTPVLQTTAAVIRPPPPLQSAPNVNVNKPSKTVAKKRTSPVNRNKNNKSPDVMITTITKPAPAKNHPAPLPPQPTSQATGSGKKLLPPKPTLKISRVAQGIVLSWNMTLSDKTEDITNYQLFAYQEGSAPPTSLLWKKVGDVKALPLPMACTLTQFQEGNKYHFAVRAMDKHQRVGPFSDPSSIHLTSKS